MKPVAHIHRDITTTVEEVADTDERLLAETGDVLLNVRDEWLPEVFYQQDVLQEWAKGWRFDLRDITAADALPKMLAALVYPTISEVAPEYATAIEPLRGADIPKTELDGPLAEILDFWVRVDGTVLRRFLCDIYDGPFDNEEDLTTAILRRRA